MIRSKYPLLKNGFAFVDGLNLPVNVHQDEKIQNAYYNGWTCSHYVSNIFCFAPDGSILFCNLKGPGSWHDAGLYSPNGLFEFPTSEEIQALMGRSRDAGP